MLRLKKALSGPQIMAQDGNAILRSLQNKSLPIVDLLVREALQNSLDASLPSSKQTDVEFNVGVFDSKEFAKKLEGIDEVLLERYSDEETYLSISDKNTFGLTGDFKSEDNESLEQSNFYKLVFGIGKNQDKEGAGGSWGLGKTSFFRIGVGVVVYYTRVQINEGYEERLIASLIENPKSPDKLLGNNPRGIAWWGEISGDNIYPITDPIAIGKILNIFGLSRYELSETGTTIVIPYINKEKNKISEDYMIYPWEQELSSKINIAIQRWYSPRIMNNGYTTKINNSMLACRVNGELITIFNMEPIFNIMQLLYNSALLDVPQRENISIVDIDRPQNIMEQKGDRVGRIAFCEVSRDDLGMNAPNNKPSGLAYLGIRDENKIEKNMSKIIAYSRKPGMVVEYGIDEGEWLPQGISVKEDHLLVAFFVPNSEGLLKDQFKEYGYKNLESYLRATESADHANWIDEDRITIVKRIKSYSKRAIEESYQENVPNENLTKISGLSRKFGGMLMPPKNFGKTSKRVSKKEFQSTEISRVKQSDIRVLESNILDSNEINIKVTIIVKKETSSNVMCQIVTQDQKMSEEKWLKLMDDTVPYPFCIKGYSIDTIDNKIIDNSDSELDVIFSLNNKPYNSIKIENSSNLTREIEATLYLEILSDQYVPIVTIQTSQPNEEGEK